MNGGCLKVDENFFLQETKAGEEKACSGRCKVILRRVIEQVRAETEQWSQMQGILGQVRKEMEELQASRDFWEDRALDSDFEIQSLNSAVRNQALCRLFFLFASFFIYLLVSESTQWNNFGYF
jgi:hypothetical protein